MKQQLQHTFIQPKQNHISSQTLGKTGQPMNLNQNSQNLVKQTYLPIITPRCEEKPSKNQEHEIEGSSRRRPP